MNELTENKNLRRCEHGGRIKFEHKHTTRIQADAPNPLRIVSECSKWNYSAVKNDRMCYNIIKAVLLRKVFFFEEKHRPDSALKYILLTFSETS